MSLIETAKEMRKERFETEYFKELIKDCHYILKHGYEKFSKTDRLNISPIPEEGVEYMNSCCREILNAWNQGRIYSLFITLCDNDVVGYKTDGVVRVKMDNPNEVQILPKTEEASFALGVIQLGRKLVGKSYDKALLDAFCYTGDRKEIQDFTKDFNWG